MKKAVLISIRPEWCEKIASGQKTIEVRKTRPKIKTPFKCYIYCTTKELLARHNRFQSRGTAVIYRGGSLMNRDDQVLCGHVIGEFICDSIEAIGVPFPAFQKEMRKEIIEQSCMSYSELHFYAGHRSLYGWHISDLVIYDKPKELSEFKGRKLVWRGNNHIHDYETIIRPPQSWCYVEGRAI